MTQIQMRDALEAEVRKCGLALNSFPKNAMGFTLDAARSTAEWKQAKSDRDAAFNKLRAFNQQFAKR